MKSNKRGLGGIGIFVVLLLIGATGAGVVYRDDLKGFVTQQTFSPAAGAEHVGTETFPVSAGSNEYLCNWDECFVKGRVPVDVSYETPRVVWRTTHADYEGGAVWTNIPAINPDKVMWTWRAGKRGDICNNHDFLYYAPNGWTVCIWNDEYLAIGDGQRYGNGNIFNLAGPNDFDEMPTTTQCYTDPLEGCEGLFVYQANINFCPTTGGNYATCPGGDRTYFEETSEFMFDSVATGVGGAGVNEIRLTQGKSVKFEALDGEGNWLDGGTIISQNYDLTCHDGMNDGNHPPSTCDGALDDAKYCLSSDRECISCRNSWGSPPNCFGSSCTEYTSTQYVQCTDTGPIGTTGKMCDIFGSVQSCEDGKYCYVGDTSGVNGWGGCACSPDDCQEPSLQQGSSPDRYQKCVPAGDCSEWDERLCPADFYFNPNHECETGCDEPVCKLDSALACDPNVLNVQCTGARTKKTCEYLEIGNSGRLEWTWGDEEDCGEMMCGALESGGNGCTCNPTTGSSQDLCPYQNAKQCISGTNDYNLCTTDGEKTCLRWRGGSYGDSCQAGSNCILGACVLSSGCANFPQDCDSAVEYCPDNECLCNPDAQDYCSDIGRKECTSSGRRICTSVPNSKGRSCGKWIPEIVPDEKICANGEFVCRDSGEYCRAGVDSTQCSSSGKVEVCVPTPSGECKHWVEDSSCDYTIETCSGGECVCDAGVQNYCSGAQSTRCQSGKVQNCVTIPGSGCKHWVDDNTCNYENERCVGGECVCDNSLPDYCSGIQSTRCYGGTIQNCVAISGSTCKHWVDGQCGEREKCVNGECGCDTNAQNYCIEDSPNECSDTAERRVCNGLINDMGRKCWEWEYETHPNDEKKCVNGEFECKTDGVYCNTPFSTRCVGTLQQRCSETESGECWYWKDDPCLGAKTCVGDSCECDITDGDLCAAGSVKECIELVPNQIRHCEPEGNCNVWKTHPCPNGELCADDPDEPGASCSEVGCAFPNTGEDCSLLTDSNGEYVETCTSNSCVCQQDDYTCNSGDYLFQELNKRCKPDGSNIVQKCVMYEYDTHDLTRSCYRWEDDEICGGREPICKLLNIL